MKKNINYRAAAELAAMPVLELVLGAVFLFNPDGALAVVFRILGWLMVGVAAVLLIGMATDRAIRPGQTVVAAVCGIGGLLLVRNPLVLAAAAGKILGALLLVQVLAGLIRGGKLREHPVRHLLEELPTLLFGAFLLLSPMAPSRLIFSLIGLALIVVAVVKLLSRRREFAALTEPGDPNIIDADE